VLAVILLQADVEFAEPTTQRQKAALTNIRGAGLRAKALIRRILRFSRPDEPARHATDASKVLCEAVELVKATLPATIEIQVDLPPTCPVTLADDNRLHQVFVNLASNAVAAMPNGGVLAFRIWQTELKDQHALSTGVIAPGGYLAISVTDTGSGIEPGTVEHMFEPFVTTKRPGDGTGLGLAIVTSVVLEHAGGVHVSSVPGAGSTFTVYLPVLDSSAPPRRTHAHSTSTLRRRGARQSRRR
jgi:signal transduction histidine kinase